MVSPGRRPLPPRGLRGLCGLHGLVALALAASVVLVGCSGGGAPDDRGTTPAPGAAATGSAETTIAERCGPQLPSGTPVEGAWLDAGHRMRLRAAVFSRGRSPVAMVLLHQVGTGLCGWGGFASQALDRGVPSVAIDLCGYGESRCPLHRYDDVVDQVDAAVAEARERLGARRVVVVGCSMGGSQAVRAVAAGARVDAWVDVSGPRWWDGVDLLDVADRAARTDRPGLVLMARSDGSQQYRGARLLAERSGARFDGRGSGHGWQLLTDLEGRRLLRGGREVLDLVEAGPVRG